jgi:hypothetical protein
MYYPCIYNYVGQIKRLPIPPLENIWATWLKTETWALALHCVLEMYFGLVIKLNCHIYFLPLILPLFEIAMQS